MQDTREITFEETSSRKRRALTIRFCVAALITTILIVVTFSAAMYYQTRQTGLIESLLQFNGAVVSKTVPSTTIAVAIKQPAQLLEYWSALKRVDGVQEITFFDRQLKIVCHSA